MKKFLLVNYTAEEHGQEVPYLWLTLKSYFQRNSINPSAWDWLDPIHDDMAESPKDLVQQIVSQEPDVIGISCYIWNDKLTMHVIKEVKKLLPDVKIIAGGPALYYEHQKNWFKHHPFIDLVCKYAGYGEVFITDYLDGKSPKEIPFAIYPDLGREVWNESTAEFNRREFNYPFPYKDNIDYLKRFAVKYPHIKVIVDTARGCPYGCTFCEWGGGTSTKVVFKELEECLSELEIAFDILKPAYVDVINANFGMITDDVIVAEKICELHKKYGSVVSVNMYGPTKTNKKNLYKIYEAFASTGIMKDVKLSIQSTDETILKNIKRIDMSYDKQIDLYDNLCKDYDVYLRFETILGLPGETLDTYYKTLGDISHSTFLYPMIHEWQMLSSAPAAHPAYVDEFKIKTKQIKYVRNNYDVHMLSRNEYVKYKNANGVRHLLNDQEFIAPYEIVVSTYSYSVDDWVQMELFKYYYTFLNGTKILVPIQNYLKENNIDLTDFNKSLFQEFLMNIPQVKMSYNQLKGRIDSSEAADIFYVDIGSNFPYLSHYSLLKFLVLINPKAFFQALSLWLTKKYGDGHSFSMLCDHIADNINTPMDQDIPERAKISQILASCTYWGGNLFHDNFIMQY